MYFYGIEKLSQQTRFDSNFNDKKKVEIESKFAEAIIRFPSEQLIAIVQNVSNCLYHILSFKRYFYRILALNDSKRYLNEFLRPDLHQIGKIPSQMWSGDILQSIINVLGNSVTSQNFTTHLQICFNIADIFIKRAMILQRFHIDFEDYERALIECYHKLYPQYLTRMNGSFLYSMLRNWIVAATPPETDLAEVMVRKRTHFSTDLPTSIMGIYGRPFSKENPDPIESHIRGADEWYILRKQKLNEISRFYRHAEQNHIPLVSGLSGSTVRWIHFLHLLGMSPKNTYSSSDFKHYTAGIVCYFVYCGHHSMHEMGYNIKLCGGEYVFGDMTSLIPRDMLSESQINHVLKMVEEKFSSEQRKHFSF